MIDGDFIIMAARLALAVILAALIGMEREIKNQPAGLRTHILVGVGACIMMLLSVYGFRPYMGGNGVQVDLARIPSYVISGLGFLGAGAIIKDGMGVRGLTTAASLWIVAGIGLVVGVGMYPLAITATAIVLFTLYLVRKMETRLETKQPEGETE
jgi:putative Mg2+ transporter-C (MgtC) family protein